MAWHSSPVVTQPKNMLGTRSISLVFPSKRTLILVPLRKNQFPPLDQALQESPKASYPKLPFYKARKKQFSVLDGGGRRGCTKSTRSCRPSEQRRRASSFVSEKKKCPHSSARGRPRPGPARAKWEGPPLHPPDGNRSFFGGAALLLLRSSGRIPQANGDRRPDRRSKRGGGGKAGLVRGAIPDPSLPPILSFSIQVPLAA